MKNKTKKIILIACAILLMILVQAIGITYAKYLTVENGKGSAEIAKWSFEIVKEGTQTKTINLADTIISDTLVDGKIAPGTSGYFEISVDATGSEVDTSYLIDFANETNKPTNLTFTYGGLEYASLSEIGTINGKISHNAETRTKDIVVFWKWGYETGKNEQEISENDVIDTQEANKSLEYTFDIIVTGTQSV